jgi:amino-acid N-acetyltransferase
MEGIRALLDEAGLPTSDLASSKAQFIVIHNGARIVGTGALQHFDDAALLRSVAVSTNERHHGIGKLIMFELERRARAAQVENLVLLTQTAEQFFNRLGYRTIDRKDAPRAVHESDEFKSLCPASAVCMSKPLIPSTGKRS